MSQTPSSPSPSCLPSPPFLGSPSLLQSLVARGSPSVSGPLPSSHSLLSISTLPLTSPPWLSPLTSLSTAESLSPLPIPTPPPPTFFSPLSLHSFTPSPSPCFLGGTLTSPLPPLSSKAFRPSSLLSPPPFSFPPLHPTGRSPR